MQGSRSTVSAASRSRLESRCRRVRRVRRDHLTEEVGEGQGLFLCGLGRLEDRVQGWVGDVSVDSHDEPSPCSGERQLEAEVYFSNVVDAALRVDARD